MRHFGELSASVPLCLHLLFVFCDCLHVLLEGIRQKLEPWCCGVDHFPTAYRLAHVVIQFTHACTWLGILDWVTWDWEWVFHELLTVPLLKSPSFSQQWLRRQLVQPFCRNYAYCLASAMLSHHPDSCSSAAPGMWDPVSWFSFLLLKPWASPSVGWEGSLCSHFLTFIYMDTGMLLQLYGYPPFLQLHFCNCRDVEISEFDFQPQGGICCLCCLQHVEHKSKVLIHICQKTHAQKTTTLLCGKKIQS